MSRLRARNMCLIMCRVQMRQIHADLLLIGCYLHPLGHCIHVHATKCLQTCICCNHDCSWQKHWVQSDHLSTGIFLIFSFHGSDPSLYCCALSFHFHVFSLDERMPSALFLPIMLRHIKDVGLVRRVSGFESHLSGFPCTKTINKTHNIIEHEHRRDWGVLAGHCGFFPSAVNRHHSAEVRCSCHALVLCHIMTAFKAPLQPFASPPVFLICPGGN